MHCRWVDKKGSKLEDYHGNVTAKIFLKWFREVAEAAHKKYNNKWVILMDNAGYHKTCSSDIDDKYWPDRTVSTARKKDLLRFLQDQKCKVSNKNKAPELRDKARQLLAKREKQVDEIAAQHGGKVIFTPPYWPEFNGIETIWGVIKKNVAANRKVYNKAEIDRLVPVAVQSCGQKTWNDCMEKQKSFEEKYFEEKQSQEFQAALTSAFASVGDLATVTAPEYDEEGINGGDDEDALDVN